MSNNETFSVLFTKLGDTDRKYVPKPGFFMHNCIRLFCNVNFHRIRPVIESEIEALTSDIGDNRTNK